jgi:hypothetical protein
MSPVLHQHLPASLIPVPLIRRPRFPIAARGMGEQIVDKAAVVHYIRCDNTLKAVSLTSSGPAPKEFFTFRGVYLMY